MPDLRLQGAYLKELDSSCSEGHQPEAGSQDGGEGNEGNGGVHVIHQCIQIHTASQNVRKANQFTKRFFP